MADRAELIEKAEGNKFDTGKLRYELLPADAIAAIVAVLTYGAAKYAPRNWEKGMADSRLVGALGRHMAAYQTGERNDPETGLPHLAHAACCVLFLLSYQLRGIGTNDMPKQDMQDWMPQIEHALSRLQQ